MLAWSRPDVFFRGDADRKVLYVTIDDAPSDATPSILSVLKENHVPATFFIVGSRVHSDAQLQRIVDARFSLGNHMRTTARCSSLSLPEFRSDFDFTDRLLRRFSAPTYFRPPSDLGTAEQMAYVASKNYQPTMGTVFPLDHWIQRPSVLAFLVRWLAVPGGIVIMHDGDERGRTTAKVLADVLPALKRAGYTFESLDRMTPAKGKPLAE
jgi:peptidoglycan/xylan/chitin deacetylase (PgdA/CDA1 family)